MKSRPVQRRSGAKDGCPRRWLAKVASDFQMQFSPIDIHKGPFCALPGSNVVKLLHGVHVLPSQCMKLAQSKLCRQMHRESRRTSRLSLEVVRYLVKETADVRFQEAVWLTAWGVRMGPVEEENCKHISVARAAELEALTMPSTCNTPVHGPQQPTSFQIIQASAKLEHQLTFGHLATYCLTSTFLGLCPALSRPQNLKA